MNKLIQRMCSGATVDFTGARKTSMASRVVLACAVAMCLAATPCRATDYLTVVDDQPRQIGPNMWRFVVQVGVRPAGTLQFANAQYDFAFPTEGIEVDYDFNGPGVDFADGREFYAIAPTLFDQLDGFIHGWDLSDLGDGVFSGVVYATAPLTAVHFTIAADQLLPVHSAPLTPAWGSLALRSRRSR